MCPQAAVSPGRHLKQALPAPHDNGENYDLILIDQVVLHQGVNKSATAENQDLLASLRVFARTALSL